jgi:hypothetical protein
VWRVCASQWSALGASLQPPRTGASTRKRFNRLLGDVLSSTASVDDEADAENASDEHVVRAVVREKEANANEGTDSTL